MQDREEDDAANAGEEDVTRCVCGMTEYYGPPLSEAFPDLDTESLNEDLGSLFIQCDGCGVWQHGGCVGIVEEDQCPDKYHCEQCRPKLHELLTDANGYVKLPSSLLPCVLVVCRVAVTALTQVPVAGSFIHTRQKFLLDPSICILLVYPVGVVTWLVTVTHPPERPLTMRNIGRNTPSTCPFTPSRPARTPLPSPITRPKESEIAPRGEPAQTRSQVVGGRQCGAKSMTMKKNSCGEPSRRVRRLRTLRAGSATGSAVATTAKSELRSAPIDRQFLTSMSQCKAG